MIWTPDNDRGPFSTRVRLLLVGDGKSLIFRILLASDCSDELWRRLYCSVG